MKHVQKNSRFYILVGERRAWNVALTNKQWGFTEKNSKLWNTTNKNEILAFYVTYPTKKIIGFGIVTDKFISDDLIWPDEILFKRSLWRYRIGFRVLYQIENWHDGIDPPKGVMLNGGRIVINKDQFTKLVKDAKEKWNIKIMNI